MSELGYHRKNFAISLASLLRECPHIQTIDFVCGKGAFPNIDPPISFSAELGDTQLRSLHGFKTIGGSIEPDFSHVFDSSCRSHLRTFLLRHPTIRTLGFSRADPPAHSIALSSSDLEALLPSLKHLEGPPFLCAPILCSKIAVQLESVVFKIGRSFMGFLNSFEDFVHSVKQMPRLKCLAIDSHFGSKESLRIVYEILSRAPELEELCLGVSFDVLVSTFCLAHST
ncbi:hypothetical protein RhiJN_25054 [Ceratobasidium sp. AG-Ba]|nr:hypothetical protein RhiJN_25054 [Ceratobasidium sp. AG-Ba]